MQVVRLEIPEGWSPALTVSRRRACLQPATLSSWIEAEVRADLPAGRHAQILSSTDARTTAGWPIRLIELDVLEDGRVVEARIIAFYLFLEHLAGATVSGADLAGRREEIAAVLMAGSPQWRDEEVVALAEVWDLRP